MEAYRVRHNKSLIDLSAQLLIDCSELNKGCEGGSPNKVFNRVLHFQADKDYPYLGKKGTCREDAAKQEVDGYVISVFNNKKDDEYMKRFLYEHGPVAALVDASSDSFRNYKSGVYYNSNCSQFRQDLHHAVLIVGYGKDPKEGDYWLLVSALTFHLIRSIMNIN